MQKKAPDWYKYNWGLGAKDASWVEHTVKEVDFIIETLGLKGGERILDLACGYGRHSLELSSRGFRVTGVDITPAFVEDAKKTAAERGLSVEFILSDIRDVDFENEFDAVLNLADGAVGYLENDEENGKIFSVVSRALKAGGRHFMEIGNADYARAHFPQRLWDPGEKMLTLSQFDWDDENSVMIYGQIDIPYGAPLPKPDMGFGDPMRLYNSRELQSIYTARGMELERTFCNYEGKPASQKDYQLIAVARRL